jgi:hypothetical protein
MRSEEGGKDGEFISNAYVEKYNQEGRKRWRLEGASAQHEIEPPASADIREDGYSKSFHPFQQRRQSINFLYI